MSPRGETSRGSPLYYESMRQLCPRAYRNELEQLISAKHNRATLLKKALTWQDTAKTKPRWSRTNAHSTAAVCHKRRSRGLFADLNAIKAHLETSHSNTLNHIYNQWFSDNNLHPCRQCNKRMCLTLHQLSTKRESTQTHQSSQTVTVPCSHQPSYQQKQASTTINGPTQSRGAHIVCDFEDPMDVGTKHTLDLMDVEHLVVATVPY